MPGAPRRSQALSSLLAFVLFPIGVLGCGGASASEGTVPPSGRCSDQAPQPLPRSVLVERRLPGCAPERGVICVDGLDDVGFAVIARVHADGRVEAVAGDREQALQASDPRALDAGGFRYVRTDREGSTELVTVDSSGRERILGGGAARPVLLGGRSFADPGDRTGRLRAELSTEGAAVLRLVDTTRDAAVLAVLPLDDVTPIERSPHVAAAGERFGLLVRRGDDAVWLTRDVNGGPVDERSIADAAPVAPVAVGPELRWIALPSSVRGVLVSGPGSTHSVPLSPLVAAAFDPCARWLYLVGGGGALLRLRLDSGDVERLGSVPSFVERLEVTAEGALLVGSSLPGGATGAPRAVVVSPSDGRSVEIPLPEDTERVSDVLLR